MMGDIGGLKEVITSIIRLFLYFVGFLMPDQINVNLARALFKFKSKQAVDRARSH